jgi:OOP family OmpA-OmpF porin
MKQITQMLVLAGFGMASGIGYAATGYVDDSAGSIVRTGYGDCLHTARWSVENAIAECDPEIVAARDKVDVAAVEVVVRKETKPIRLQADALFGFDSAQLTDAGKMRLDDLVGQLTAATLQNKKIEITGYTDRIGAEDYNRDLSKRRADAVQDYLVSKGVAPTYIESSGLGENNPVVDCKGEKGQALKDCLAPNRRTEIEFSAMEVIEVEETVPVVPE